MLSNIYLIQINAEHLGGLYNTNRKSSDAVSHGKNIGIFANS